MQSQSDVVYQQHCMLANVKCVRQARVRIVFCQVVPMVEHLACTFVH